MIPFGCIPPTIGLGCPKMQWGILCQSICFTSLSLDNHHFSLPIALVRFWSWVWNDGPISHLQWLFCRTGPLLQHSSGIWSLRLWPLGFICARYATVSEFILHKFFSCECLFGWFQRLCHVTKDLKPHLRSITRFQLQLCIHFPWLKLALYWSNLRWSLSHRLYALTYKSYHIRFDSKTFLLPCRIPSLPFRNDINSVQTSDNLLWINQLHNLFLDSMLVFKKRIVR